MDLFTPVVPQERLHPNFLEVTQPERFEFTREVLNNWANGFKDRDNKFVQEFQKTFDSSFWELYLFACFKELGCSSNLSYPSPDFVLTSPYGEFIAEATISQAPYDYRPESDKAMLKEPGMADIIRLSTIRLLNSITNKVDRFKTLYSTYPYVQNKPFVICISCFDQPFFFKQYYLAIRQVLYAYDQRLTIPDIQEGEVLIVGESRKYEVQKKPNVELKLGLFLDETLSDVSAVIFSTAATTSKIQALATGGKDLSIFVGSRGIKSKAGVVKLMPFATRGLDYQETLLDGLNVFFNPFAKYPLDPKIFEGREIALHNYQPKTDNYQVSIPNNFLYVRRCWSPKFFDTEEALNSYQTSIASTKTYKELPLEIWKENELMYMVGKNISFCENYMGHYRGWSILVSLNTTTQRWRALAVNTLCYTYPQFLQVTGDKHMALTILEEWLSTKEEVYTSIKSKIDEISEQA